MDKVECPFCKNMDCNGYSCRNKSPLETLEADLEFMQDMVMGLKNAIDTVERRREGILEIAEELDRWCKGKMTHHQWCGCQIADRLRKLCA